MDFMITPMEREDWPDVCDIYRQGIATGNATFETELPDWQKWNDTHRPDCRLVAREQKMADRSDGRLLGWAALRPVSSRRVYAGVAEVSVYVAETARGRGIGGLLLQALVEESERRGIWTLQAGIFPENVPSIKVHLAVGFREIGLRSRIGKMGDIWRDLLLLERRSPTVGL